MNKYVYFFLVLAFVSGSVIAQEKQNKQPNIVFILADDLGYGNLSSYNKKSPVPTPNIDKLAQEGVKFTRFYSGSTVCAPSRASLMTGLTMGHAWVRGNAKAREGKGALRAQDTTLAQRLQAGGYVTGMFGKWGLGDEDTQGAPHLKGFNEFYGYLEQSHAHNYFSSYLFEIRDNATKRIQIDSSDYVEDLIVNKALDFVKRNKDKPFFLYLPITLPHAELKVPEELMKRFQNEDGSSKFGPEKPYKGVNQYDPQPQPRAAFAAMLTKLDSDVGKVANYLKDLGLDDNTYIFFTSDNGPHQEGGGDPVFFNSSGPLRGLKRDLYEGGIRVPMIVRSPGKVPAGKVSDIAWAFWDVLPTVTQLGSTRTPANIDGISFVNAITGKRQLKQHDYLYWQFNEDGLKEALMTGDWKLVRFKSKGSAERLELYNLKTDLAETLNLAETNIAKVNELKTLMLQAKTPAENKTFDWSEEEL